MLNYPKIRKKIFLNNLSNDSIHIWKRYFIKIFAEFVGQYIQLVHVFEYSSIRQIFRIQDINKFKNQVFISL
jgi:hypothetical protein